MKGYRKLTLGSKVFYYRIGKSHINIRKENRITVCNPSFSDISGLSWHEVERGIHKGWFSITPSTISQYLEEHFSNELQ